MSDDASAFPLHLHGDYGKGMSLRDYFAAAALQGLLAHVIGVANAKNELDYAKRCYQYADAMLAARKEGA
jgi:hypothetical protein